MTSAQDKINSSKPEWLNNLSVTCQNCQQPSSHLAFIETTSIDPSTNKQITLIEDYHFCKQCNQYWKTRSTHDNYTLFYNNTISKRVDPKTKLPLKIPLDQSY